MKRAVAIVLTVLLTFFGTGHILRAGRNFAKQLMTDHFESRSESDGRVTGITNSLHSDQVEVALYYRFANTSYLGVEMAAIDLHQEDTVATAMIEELINGPSVSHDRLSGLFPQGTQLLGVNIDGSTVHVVLDRHFLGQPVGAPSDWEDSQAWQEEATLRRRLALQSIVLTLTEEGRWQRVQLYVADNFQNVPTRIPLAWFDLTVQDTTVMLGSCGRDEGLCLTPSVAMGRILSAWQQRDWKAIYPFLSREDGIISESEFAAEMNEAGTTLLGYSVTPGTISTDGSTATLVVEARIRSDTGNETTIERESVALHREEDNWSLQRSTLSSLMIRD